MKKHEIIAQYCNLELDRIVFEQQRFDVADPEYIEMTGKVKAFSDILRLLGQ